MAAGNDRKKPKKSTYKKLRNIVIIELIILLFLFGAYKALDMFDGRTKTSEDTGEPEKDSKPSDKIDVGKKKEQTKEELEALEEQERIVKEIKERDDLVERARRLMLGYDYDGALELIKSYKGSEGGYNVYPSLVSAISDIEAQKKSLVLYGGVYSSVTQINHIFFHSLIADNSKAFDGDSDSVGYNMYMTTIREFKNMIQSMYEDGYVLVSIHDIAGEVVNDDGTREFAAKEFYLPQGKKPFVLSQDDVSYYEYMEGDGFATRIVIGEDGKPTCEMVADDGSIITGPFDMIPIIDEFVEEHPDFSYNGAKGIIALTGYEGVLGYRTNDPDSPTYEEDVRKAKEVAEALKENGWEFASHSWGHKNMREKSYEFVKKDTERWLEEVAPIIGPTDILIFPFGVDIETTMGHYSSDKFNFLKEKGFNYYCGVYREPWMHIKKDYVRMTRRPLDGQAMLEFPERLADLFNLSEIIDPERPPKNW
jgi:hypothetical protein